MKNGLEFYLKIWPWNLKTFIFPSLHEFGLNPAFMQVWDKNSTLSILFSGATWGRSKPL